MESRHRFLSSTFSNAQKPLMSELRPGTREKFGRSMGGGFFKSNDYNLQLRKSLGFNFPLNQNVVAIQKKISIDSISVYERQLMALKQKLECRDKEPQQNFNTKKKFFPKLGDRKSSSIKDGSSHFYEVIDCSSNCTVGISESRSKKGVPYMGIKFVTRRNFIKLKVI